jgi:Mg-chelatase subunit ChlD
MDVLQREMCDFVDTVHDDGRCLGAVSTFDTEVSVGEMNQQSSSVESTLRGLSTGGGTALYDSIVAVMANWQRARIEANRVETPALLVTITDGMDNESANSIEDVREAIAGTGFHPKNRCYFVLIGVGSDVSESELRQICEGGLGMYEHVSHVEEVLRLVLAATLVGVVKQERYRKIEESADELSVTELRRELAAVGVRKLDYTLNVDTSGSMSDAA